MGRDKVKKGHQAVVEKVIPDGRHGPYVVAHSSELGSITFSLSDHVWEESDVPEPGMMVMLYELRKKRAGWRAQRGRFIEPSDEQQPENQEHRA